MIDVLTVAKYVINSSLRQGKPVTNLKLQSILYLFNLYLLKLF